MSIGGQDAHLVIGDGTNQTAQLRAALVAARDSATIKTVRVLGTVLIDPTHDETSDAAGMIVYPGCTLEGAGYASEVRFRPDAPIDGRDYYGFRYYSDVTFRDFRLNGNKAAFAAKDSGWIDHGQLGFIGAYQANARNVTVENLWIHDLLGKGSESFGILTADGNANVRIRGCRAWNVDGTGISPNGNIGASPRTRDVEVSDCSCWDNGWQGFSVFGCDDVRISDCRAWGNDSGGFNVEWSTGVDIADGLAHGNGLGGLTTYGDVTVRLFGCRFFGNSTAATNNNGNEVMVQKGYAATTEVGRLVEVRGCSIAPPTGRAHVWYQVDAALPRPRPTLLLDGPGVEGWLVQNNDGSPHSTVTRLVPRPPSAGGVTAVADGGTIAHGLRVAPRRYGATATVAGQIVAVTAASATALTVAVRTGAGAAVTAATPVAWWAEA